MSLRFPAATNRLPTLAQGTELYRRLSQSFGYLNMQGYCAGGSTFGEAVAGCRKFPVVIGESGTGFAVGQGGCEKWAWKVLFV